MILALATGKLSAQVNRNLSIEGGVGHYQILHSSNEKLNQEYSLLFSNYVYRLKISAGVSYSAFVVSTDSIEYHMKYLDYPVFIQPPLYYGEKYHVTLVAGVQFHKALYNTTFPYVNKGGMPTVAKSEVGLGSTFIGGFSVSRKLNDHFYIALTPLAKYRTNQGVNRYPVVSDLHIGGVMRLGGKISLEYLFHEASFKKEETRN